MSYSFVHTQRPQFPLRVLCQTVGVTESGYHSWRARPQKRVEDDAQLLAHIKTVHDDSKGRTAPPGCTGSYEPPVCAVRATAWRD